MSDKVKISQLPSWTPIDTDIIPYVDLVTWITKKAPKSSLKWDTGDNATINVWTTTTWVPWSSASVTNVWTTSDAIFDFVIPEWEQWIQGIQWETWNDWLDITWLWAYNWATSYVINDAVSYNWSSYICKLASIGNLPTNATYFDLMAQKWDDWTWTWDMLKSENLSWLTDYWVARDNLDVYSTTEVDTALWLKQNLALTNLASTNLNTIVTNWKYCAAATCTNLPETSVKTRLIVNVDPTNSDLAMQEALTTTTQVSYVRTTANGWSTWTAWARIKTTDETKVSLTWNETIAWIKTFSSKVNVTYWEGIYNNTVTANPLIKSDYDFSWTWFWDSTRITPWWNFVTTNAVYSANNRNGSIWNFHIAWQLETTWVIQLWNASDTTLSRVSAWVVAIEWVNIVKAWSITTNWVTMSTNKLLGRNTAWTGAVEEITLWTWLSFSWTTLNASSGGSKIITWTRTLTTASGTVTYTHWLGRTPTSIEINWMVSSADTISPISISFWWYDTSNKCCYWWWTTVVAESSTFAINWYWNSSSQYQRWVIQNLTTTTFDIVWTKTGSPTTTLCFTAIIS